MGGYYIAKTDTFGSVYTLFYPDNMLLRDLAWDGEHIWMIDAKGDISAFDSSGTPMESIAGLLGAGWGLTYGDGPFWASDPAKGMIYKLDLPTGVETDSSEGHPAISRLHYNYPNPFSGATTIRYSVPRSRGAEAQGRVLSTYPFSPALRPEGLRVRGKAFRTEGQRINLSVYNLGGSLVRTLVDGPREAGHHAVSWHGKDEFGREVEPGVYFYRLTMGGKTFTRKAVVLR